MEAGKLTHRIEIQKKTYSQDQATGEMVLTWTLFAKIWARVTMSSARQLMAAKSMQSQVSGNILIRYRDDLDYTMRILHRGRVFDIEGLIPDNESGIEWLTIPVSEGLNNG